MERLMEKCLRTIARSHQQIDEIIFNEIVCSLETRSRSRDSTTTSSNTSGKKMNGGATTSPRWRRKKNQTHSNKLLYPLVIRSKLAAFVFFFRPLLRGFWHYFRNCFAAALVHIFRSLLVNSADISTCITMISLPPRCPPCRWSQCACEAKRIKRHLRA